VRLLAEERIQEMMTSTTPLLPASSLTPGSRFCRSPRRGMLVPMILLTATKVEARA